MKAKLRCKHCIGRNCKDYTMDCEILKEMPDSKRYKVRVFGERFWDRTQKYKDKQRIRYVDKERIIK